MPYVRKSPAGVRRKSVKRTASRVVRKRASSTNMVALIKKTMMKTAETKKYEHALSVPSLYHNLPVVASTNLLYTSQVAGTLPGLRDTRIGDSIQATGITFKFGFLTLGDRPNVTFKAWVIRTPAYNDIGGVFPYQYPVWFDAATNLWPMDDLNKENVTLIKSFMFKPPVADSSQEASSALHETTFFRKFYVPINKTIVYQDFGTSSAPSSTQTKGFAYQLLVAAYDSYSTLQTDIAGKMMIQHTLHYKDF